MEKADISEGLASDDLAGSCALGVNDARTGAPGDTNLTQAGSPGVHGWTYFLLHKGKVKIGFSERPRHRISYHRRGRPGLKVLAVVPSSVAGEFETHQRFADLRADDGTEWFRSNPKLRAFIRRVKKAGAKIAAPPIAGQPKFTLPVDPVIARLIATRELYGATSAAGYRCSNLVEMIPAYQAAKNDPDRRAFLAAGIQRQMTDLAQHRDAFQ